MASATVEGGSIQCQQSYQKGHLNAVYSGPLQDVVRKRHSTWVYPIEHSSRRRLVEFQPELLFA